MASNSNSSRNSTKSKNTPQTTTKYVNNSSSRSSSSYSYYNSNNYTNYNTNTRSSSNSSSYNIQAKKEETIKATKSIISSTTTTNNNLTQTIKTLKKEIKQLSSNINSIKIKSNKLYRTILSPFIDKDSGSFKFVPGANNLNTTNAQMRKCLSHIDEARYSIKKMSNSKLTVSIVNQVERIVKLINNSNNNLDSAYQKLSESEKNAKGNVDKIKKDITLDPSKTISLSASNFTFPKKNIKLGPIREIKTGKRVYKQGPGWPLKKESAKKITGTPIDSKGPRSRWKINSKDQQNQVKEQYFVPAPSTVKEQYFVPAQEIIPIKKPTLIDYISNALIEKSKADIRISGEYAQLTADTMKLMGKIYNNFKNNLAESITNNWEKLPTPVKYGVRTGLEAANGFLDFGYKTGSAFLNAIVFITGSEKVQDFLSTYNIDTLRAAQESLLPLSEYNSESFGPKLVFESSNLLTELLFAEVPFLLFLNTNGKYVQDTYVDGNNPSSKEEIRMTALQTFIPSALEFNISLLPDNFTLALTNSSTSRKIISNIGINTAEAIAATSAENYYKSTINNEDLDTFRDFSIKLIPDLSIDIFTSDEFITLTTNSGTFNKEIAEEVLEELFKNVVN